jgi:hypothetical protein
MHTMKQQFPGGGMLVRMAVFFVVFVILPLAANQPIAWATLVSHWQGEGNVLLVVAEHHPR